MKLTIDPALYEQLCAADESFRARWALMSRVQATLPAPAVEIRYGVEYCLLCKLALIYCRCGSAEAEDVYA
jgi:hypothetical protein